MRKATASTARLSSALLLLAALTAPSVSHAGALGRPNIFGAVGLGIGGAGFAGVPNPSTIHFNPAGLTLMRETVGPEMGVKASGGIRDRETAEQMVAAGATRIGASASVASRG